MIPPLTPSADLVAVVVVKVSDTVQRPPERAHNGNNLFFLQPSVLAYASRKAVLFLLFYLTNLRKNGRTLFGAKYGRTYSLTGKHVSVSFTHIRPGFFPGLQKPVRKELVFGLRKYSTKTRFLIEMLTRKVPLMIAASPLPQTKKCKVNRQFWVGDAEI